MKRIANLLWRMVFGVALGVCSSCAGVRTAPSAASSPAKQLSFDEAFTRGLEAATQQQWDQAIMYFTTADERARSTGAVSPGLLFNLGLAHAKAGNDATAIAWCEAYLAAVPDAPNAAMIRAGRQRLEAALEAKAKLLFEEAIQAAQPLPLESGVRSGIGVDLAKAGYLDWAVEVYHPQVDAAAGDVAGYLAKFRSGRTRDSAKTLMDVGDVDAALALVPQITDASDRDGFWQDLGYYYLYSATPFDAARSLEALTRIEDPSYREVHLNGTAARRQELQQTPPTVTEPPAVQAWSDLARAHCGHATSLTQDMDELATNTTRSTPTHVILRITEIASGLHVQLFRIRALETHLARRAAVTGATIASQ